MDSDLQWLLCLILPLTILISQAPSELFLSLGSKREKSLATPMFQVLLSACATQSGIQEGLETINLLKNCYSKGCVSLRGVDAHWMCKSFVVP
jgi:hypothetical protein